MPENKPHNTLFGPHFIQQLRSSGYKNPIYAMAEIIDNAVDANSSKIDITIVEKNIESGGQTTRKIQDVFFIDNGDGMTFKEINGCLRFADGAGRRNDRIGAFGVGLPNSSIFVGKRVEVFSKDKENNQWNYVYLDVDEQLRLVSPGYKTAVAKSPAFQAEKINLDLNLNEISTIVRWSKIDNIGAAKASTVIKRSSKLTGRIYRYGLLNSSSPLKIFYKSLLIGNNMFTEEREVIPYDPLFVTNKKTEITEILWRAAEMDNYNPKLPDNEEFNAKKYYEKFVKDCQRNISNKALFQRFDEYWGSTHKVRIGAEVCQFQIKASYAYQAIKNPGRRNGGATIVGEEIGKKMDGTRYFKSSNIFFVRTGREIDFGNYAFYKNRDPQNRFWTIEIHFGPELDSLMGLDYQKQHVSFEYTKESDKQGIDNSYNSDLTINEKRVILYSEMTRVIDECVEGMQKQLKTFGSLFKDKENISLKQEVGEEVERGVPGIEGTTIKAIPKSEEEWDKEDKEQIIKFLKKKFKEIPINFIRKQVESYSKGHTKTIVLYRENESNNLFELTTVRGIDVTFINKKHQFYQNFIGQLKSNYKLGEFTTAIEILICSFAYQLGIEKRERTDKEKTLIQNFIDKTSGVLTEFINNGKVTIDSKAWEEKLAKLEELPK